MVIDKIAVIIMTIFAGAGTPLPSDIGWQHDNEVTVNFIQPELMDATCGNANPDVIVAACVKDIGVKYINLPNPCRFKDDTYARIACHELAHTNWWKHEYK